MKVNRIYNKTELEKLIEVNKLEFLAEIGRSRTYSNKDYLFQYMREDENGNFWKCTDKWEKRR